MANEHVDAAEKNLERLLEWITRFDARSGLVLSINTGMIGVLAASAPAIDKWTWLSGILFAVSVALQSVCFVALKWANYPNLIAPSNSLLFFGTIASMKCDDFCHRFKERSQREYLSDLLEQCHRNSEILTEKFRLLKIAFRLLLASLLPWAACIAVWKLSS